MPEESDLQRTAIERIGLDPDNLGFVGLEVELPPIYRMALEPTWAYTSPKYKYVRGYDGNPHVTLIYGLLFSAAENRDLVDGVMKDWHKPNLLVMPEVKAFDNEDDYEFYSAIVLTFGENAYDLGQLKEANDALRTLPHVNSYPVYEPHITVGYVRRGFRDQAIQRIKDLEVRPFHTRELEYT